MLTSVTIFETTTARAAGQYDMAEAQFISDQTLTGQTLKVDLGLFKATAFNDTSSGNAWAITYPSSPGTYEMAYQGLVQAENYRIDLEVIDSVTFKIQAYFMMRADTGNFVSEGGANNQQSFTALHFQGGADSVYNSAKWFAIRAEVNGESAIHWRPFGGNYFNNSHSLNYTLRINGAEVTGHVPGQDLEVEFDIDTALADAGFDVAVIRVDDIGPTDFITAHSLNYARVNSASGVNQVDILPADAIKSAQAINNSVPGYSTGKFTIDGSYFTNEGVYQFFVVYKVLGLYLSVKSPDIEQSPITSQYEPTYGTVSCLMGQVECINFNVTSSYDPDGNVYNVLVTPGGSDQLITGGFGVTEDGTTTPLTVGGGGINATWNVSGSVLTGSVFLTVYLDGGGTASLQAPLLSFPGQNFQVIEECVSDAVATCCLEGICPGQLFSGCVIMNQAEYNQAVIDNGVTGSFTDNLVGITAGVVNNLSAPPFTFDIPLDVEVTGGQGCVEFTIPEDWANTARYIVFVYQFDLGTHMDYIYKPMRIGVGSASLSAVIVDIRDENNNALNVLCNELTGVATVKIAGDFSDCDLEVSIGEQGSNSYTTGPINVIQGSGTTDIQIDLSLLGDFADKTYCLRLECSEEPILDGGGCEAGCFDISLSQETVTAGNPANVELTFTVPADVDTVAITTDQGASGIFGGSGTFSFNQAPSGPMVPVTYTIVVTRDGCVYQTEVTLNSCNVDGDVYAVSYNICNEPPEASCNNVIGILTGCDPSAGPGGELINATADVSGATNIDTQTFEYSLDGITYQPYGGGDLNTTQAYFRLTVTFTDGCKTLVANESVTCFGNSVLICDNEPIIGECIFDAEAETLTVANEGIYTSPVADPNFDYSLDGGATWTPILGPISTTGLTDGQVILIRLNPIYSDGCPQGPEVIKECVFNESVSSCDYTGFELSCTVEDSTFTPTFTGDETGLEVNDKEFSENGGGSWEEYTGIGVVSASQTVLWRWTLKYPGCDTETLVTGCTKDCNLADFPTELNVNIVNDSITVDIPDCIGIYDCLDNCTVEAGDSGNIELCDPLFPFKT